VINWALQPIWDVPEQNKKLDYFCKTEIGQNSPCSLGGKQINSALSYWETGGLGLVVTLVLLSI